MARESKMKKDDRVSVLAFSLLALFIWGCSGIEVSQDYTPGSDFNQLKIFAWKDKDQKKTGDIRVDSQLLDDRIRRATEAKLLEKGVTKSTGQPPDFFIKYRYSISQKVYTTPLSTGLGLGYGSYGSYGSVGIRTGTEINEYDEGLLVIDFLKPGSDVLLWRGTSTRMVETHSTPEKTLQDIDQTIGKMLDQFPPDKSK